MLSMIIAHCTSRALYSLQTKPRNEYCRVVLKQKACPHKQMAAAPFWQRASVSHTTLTLGWHAYFAAVENLE